MTVIEFGKQHHDTMILLLGGLSLGGQIAVKMLSRRKNICRFALIESVLVKPMKLTA